MPAMRLRSSRSSGRRSALSNSNLRWSLPRFITRPSAVRRVSAIWPSAPCRRLTSASACLRIFSASAWARAAASRALSASWRAALASPRALCASPRALAVSASAARRPSAAACADISAARARSRACRASAADSSDFAWRLATWRSTSRWRSKSRYPSRPRPAAASKRSSRSRATPRPPLFARSRSRYSRESSDLRERLVTGPSFGPWPSPRVGQFVDAFTPEHRPVWRGARRPDPAGRTL